MLKYLRYVCVYVIGSLHSVCNFLIQKYDLFCFADVVHQGPLRRRYAIGSVSKIKDPYSRSWCLNPKRREGVKRSTTSQFNAALSRRQPSKGKIAAG